MAENSKSSTEKRKSIFETLSKIDVSNYVDKKDGRKPLTYLSWANAWGLVKKYYPQANYQISEFPEYIRTNSGWTPTGRNVDYRQTEAGYEVEATVEIEGEKYSSKLFVMDNRYKAILENATYFDINKTQQRALVKAIAFAGLGLKIYAGEDLPEDMKSNDKVQQTNKTQYRKTAKKLTIDELKKYNVTINGKTGSLLSLFKNALKGNSSASRWLEMNHDAQTNNAIRQLKAYYQAMENDKKKKQAEQERQEKLATGTAKIENSKATAKKQNETANDNELNVVDTEETEDKATEQKAPKNKDAEDVFKALNKYAG